ncbi:MAG: hypothetical protein AAFU60_14605, partial [Bacteroidota bacterium]
MGRWFVLGGGIGLTHSPNRIRLEFPAFGTNPAYESVFRSNVYYVDLRLQSKLILWRDRSQGFLRAEGYGGPFLYGSSSFKDTTLEGEILDQDQTSTFGNGSLYQFGVRLGLGTRWPLGSKWLIAPEIVTDRPFLHPGSIISYTWRWGLQIGVFRK